MKKISATLSIILLVLVCSCSDGAKSKLSLICEQTNKQLPQNIGVAVFNSMTYEKDSNCVLLSYFVDESVIDIDMISRSKKEQEDYMRTFLCQPDNAELLSALAGSGAEVKVVFEGMSSHEKAEMTVEPEEIKKLKTTESKDDNFREQLEKIVATSNAQCPSDLGDGLFMSSVTLDSCLLSYNFTYDPEQLSFDDADSPENRQKLFETLSAESKGIEVSHLFMLLKELGYGIQYRYQADSDSAAADSPGIKTIVFTAEEVKKM